MNWNIAGIVHIIETIPHIQIYLIDGSVTKRGIITSYDEEWILIELINGMTHVIYEDEIQEYHVKGNMLSIKLI